MWLTYCSIKCGHCRMFSLFVKQVRCFSKSALLSSVIGNFENPLQIGRGEGGGGVLIGTFFLSCCMGCVLEKQKTKETSKVCYHTIVTCGDKYMSICI